MEGEYPNLKHLEASYNKLTNIDLGQFENLEVANLNNNQLTNISCTNRLDSLEILGLEGNPKLQEAQVKKVTDKFCPKLGLP